MVQKVECLQWSAAGEEEGAYCFAAVLISFDVCMILLMARRMYRSVVADR